MIKLSPQELATIKAVLAEFAPGVEARVFGSRVRGDAGPFADLDLVLAPQKPLDKRLLAEIKDAFSESDLPFCVDVLDWSALSESFRTTIGDSWQRL